MTIEAWTKDATDKYEAEIRLAKDIAECTIPLLEQIKDSLPKGVRSKEFEERDDSGELKYVWTISYDQIPGLPASALVKRRIGKLDPNSKEPSVLSVSLSQKGGKLNKPYLSYKEGLLSVPFSPEVKDKSENLVADALAALYRSDFGPNRLQVVEFR